MSGGCERKQMILEHKWQQTVMERRLLLLTARLWRWWWVIGVSSLSSGPWSSVKCVIASESTKPIHIAEQSDQIRVVLHRVLLLKLSNFRLHAILPEWDSVSCVFSRLRPIRKAPWVTDYRLDQPMPRKSVYSTSSTQRSWMFDYVCAVAYKLQATMCPLRGSHGPSNIGPFMSQAGDALQTVTPAINNATEPHWLIWIS